MLVFTTLNPDPRVWQEAETLSVNGYRVTILARRGKGQKHATRCRGFLVRRPFEFSPFDPRPWKAVKVWLGFLGYVFSRRRERVAVVHCHDAETLPFGLILAKRDKARVVYDAHELFFDYIPTSRYTSSALEKVKARVLRKIMSLIERGLIKRCDQVATVNSSLSRLIQSHHGLKERPVFFYNTRRYTDTPKTAFLRERLGIPAGGKVLFYQGAIRPDREIERIVEVLAVLEGDWFLVVAGQVIPSTYLDRLKRLADRLNVSDRFLYAGLMEYDKELLVATASSDVGIFLLPPTNLTYTYSLANKFFDYVMAEVPLVVNDLPEMKSVIDRYGVGVAVPLDRKREIAETIQELVGDKMLYSEIVSRIRQAKRALCWERQEKKLLAVYRRLQS
jgi:glycosyltransferase involved in cell wall biosynthesis